MNKKVLTELLLEHSRFSMKEIYESRSFQTSLLALKLSPNEKRRSVMTIERALVLVILVIIIVFLLERIL